MSASRRGAVREHQVKRQLEAEGWAVTRGAGSHGCADLWAAREESFVRGHGQESLTSTELRLIQVKTDKRSPYDHFVPKEREALIALGDQTGGEVWLVWWPANKPCQWIAEREWPRAKVAA